MSNDRINQIVESVFKEFAVAKIEQIQPLWSSYGEISRFKIAHNNSSFNYCIIKYISFLEQTKHPRGWQSEFSHNRKIESYFNEQLFYQHYANHLPKECKTPTLLATGNSENELWLLMEDMDQLGLCERITPKFANPPNYSSGEYLGTSTNTNDKHSLQILNREDYLDKMFKIADWLANFHAYFLNTSFDKFENLGTYWHLDTRPEEFDAMSEGQLKESALKIDNLLKNATFQTCLHGDAKIANFCFSPNKKSYSQQPNIAAVDFQYCGRGVGTKDLVYFLGSCFDSNGLYEFAHEVEKFYFEKLQRALAERYFWALDKVTELTLEWQHLIPFAWADFERFLLGWASEHVKLNHYSASQTAKALQLLE